MSELSDIENYYELMAKANSIFLKLNSENMRLREELAEQQKVKTPSDNNNKCVWKEVNDNPGVWHTECGSKRYLIPETPRPVYCPNCGWEIEVTE